MHGKIAFYVPFMHIFSSSKIKVITFFYASIRTFCKIDALKMFIHFSKLLIELVLKKGSGNAPPLLNKDSLIYKPKNLQWKGSV